MKLIEQGRVDPLPLATHRFGLEQIAEAYDVLADAATTQALKIVLSAQPVESTAAGTAKTATLV